METKQATHTPGPWHWKQDATLGGFSIWEDQPSRDTIALTIATVRPGPRDIDRGDIPTQTLEANARLIATAPKLLAALDALTAAIDLLSHTNDQAEMRDAAINAAYDDARDAIQKARGQ